MFVGGNVSSGGASRPLISFTGSESKARTEAEMRAETIAWMSQHVSGMPLEGATKCVDLFSSKGIYTVAALVDNLAEEEDYEEYMQDILKPQRKALVKALVEHAGLSRDSAIARRYLPAAVRAHGSDCGPAHDNESAPAGIEESEVGNFRQCTSLSLSSMCHSLYHLDK